VTVRRFPIEAGHVLQFCRAIGLDPDPVDADSLQPPPTFTRAAVQFDPNHGRNPKSPEEPPTDGPVGSVLHAEQHFEYHRPVRCGDVLTVEEMPGATWERDSRRAGKLTFTETITRYRTAGGDLAVTGRMVIVATERPVDGG
jgi:hydroxyacyl-ACP dehydratase HTD2-like protein with hotdog domain